LDVNSICHRILIPMTAFSSEIDESKAPALIAGDKFLGVYRNSIENECIYFSNFGIYFFNPGVNTWEHLRYVEIDEIEDPPIENRFGLKLKAKSGAVIKLNFDGSKDLKFFDSYEVLRFFDRIRH